MTVPTLQDTKAGRPASRGRGRNARQWLLLSGVLAAMGALVAWSRYADLRDDEADQRLLLSVGAQSIDENLSRQLVGIGEALKSVRDDRSTGPQTQARSLESRRLSALVRAIPGLRAMLICTRDGRVVASSRPDRLGIDLHAQPQFQRAAASPVGKMLLTPPAVTLQGDLALHMTLVLADSDGAFDGVAMATLDVDFLRGLMRAVRYAPDMWAGVAHTSGIALLQEPPQPDLGGRNLDQPGSQFRRHRESGQPVTVFSGWAGTTGDERILVQRTVQPASLALDDGIVIATSRSLKAIVAPWRRQTAIYAALYAVIVATSVAGLLAMQRRQRAIEGMRTQREAAERLSAERLDLALRGADLGLWDLDVRSGDSVVSERWDTMLGLPHQLLYSQSSGWRERVHPDDWDRVREAHERHLAGQSERFDETYRMRHADGHWVWVLDRGQVLERDAGGAPLRMVGTHMDVTEATERQLALRANEQRLQALLDNLRAGVVVHAPDTRILDANPEARRILGLTLEQMQGLQARDPAWCFIEEDQSTMPLERYPATQVAADGHRLQNFVLGIRRSDKPRPVWVLVDAYPVHGEDGALEQIMVTFSDITERREAEAELKLLATAVARLNDVVIITEAAPLEEPGPRITFVNDAFERLTGWTRGDALGRSPRFLQGPRTDQRSLERLGTALRSSRAVQVELINYNRQGQEYWVEIGIVPILDPSGRATHHVAIQRDITERKLDEQRILSARSALEATLEAIPDLLFEMDLAGCYHGFHSPRHDLLFPNPGSFIGRLVAELLPAGSADVVLAALRQAHEAGFSTGLQYDLTLPQGTFWFELSVARKASAEGESERFIVLARDITARRQAEDLLQRMNRSLRVLSSCTMTHTEVVDEASYLKAVCRSVVEVGGYVMAWVGYARNDEDKTVRVMAAVGRLEGYLEQAKVSWDALRPEGQGPTGTAIRTGQTQVNQRWDSNPRLTPWRQAAADRGFGSSVAIPLFMDRQCVGALNLYANEPDAFDAAEVPPLEELARHVSVAIESLRARQQRDVAEAASRAKSAFLANMSHEIRTPLNAIIGLNYLLRRDGVRPEQAARIDKIDAAGQHLLAIVNDVLDLSKIEAGRVQLESTNFHLSSILDSVHSILAESARAKGLTIEVDGSGVPVWLRGDPTRLRQALLNYAGNAVKFTDKGRIALRAKLLNEEGPVLQVRFSVEDSGIGIPADQLPRLFRAFEQAEAGTSRRFGGTGLGLSITQRLAQLMGGECGVESRPGAGSTFWFTARIERGQGPMPVSPVRDAATVEARLREGHRGARVLLAEDNEVNREVALAILHAVGLDVDIACDGREAVTMARARTYDLVLMDMQMPNMDGLAATGAIRQLPGWAQVPVVALTANAFHEDRMACQAAGMNDFIGKPMNIDETYQKLLQWLDVSRGVRARPDSPA